MAAGARRMIPMIANSWGGTARPLLVCARTPPAGAPRVIGARGIVGAATRFTAAVYERNRHTTGTPWCHYGAAPRKMPARTLHRRIGLEWRKTAWLTPNDPGIVTRGEPGAGLEPAAACLQDRC